MLLTELGNCEGAAVAEPSSPCSVLRVAFHNLLLASESEAPMRNEVAFALVEFLSALEAKHGNDASRISVDQAHGVFFKVIARHSDRLLFNRTGPLESFKGERALSFQPSWAFEYWLPADPVAAKPEHSDADIKHLAKALRDRDLPVLISGFTVHKVGSERRIGAPGGVVFLTPRVGEAAEMFAKAETLWNRRGAIEDELAEAGIATRLRNLLGLCLRNEADPAVMLQTKATIEGLGGGAHSKRKSGVSSSDTVKVAAPTQFDAGLYPRFRHWPSKSDEVTGDFGRTWDLDDRHNRKGPDCGAPEFVVTPLRVEEIESIVPIGAVDVDIASHLRTRQEDADFADRICGALSLPAMAEALGKRFKI